MLQTIRLPILILLALAANAATALADATLKMGDPAPALAVAKFVKGEPVKSFEKGKIYVVEFWATWCAPCRELVPHLTELQKAYPAVIFIGSNVGETEDKVLPFIKEMGDQMNYRVALDDLTVDGGANNHAFMDAAGLSGIPIAFIIDKEMKIAWIGYPGDLEPVLKQVISGTFDVKQAAIEVEAKNKIMSALQNGDFDAAIKGIDDQIATNPGKSGKMAALEMQILLKGKKDLTAAAKRADELSTKLTDPDALGAIAWDLATTDGATPGMLATARKMSEASLKASPDKPDYLDTLARIYADQGDFKKAADTESTAVKKSTDPKIIAELNKSLDAYKAGKIPAGE